MFTITKRTIRKIRIVRFCVFHLWTYQIFVVSFVLQNTRRIKMNQEKLREAYEKMLKKCPDILTPMKATRWSPVGKNTIYTALKNGEIESYTYKGGYIFTKDAFIDYLVKTTNDKGKRYTIRGDKKC